MQDVPFLPRYFFNGKDLKYNNQFFLNENNETSII